MSCYKSSNNRFFNSAARMSDGRLFTDNRPNFEINNHLINNNDLKNMHEYRNFLSRNTEEIIKRNQDYIYLKNGLFNCKKPFKVGTMLPERTRMVFDKHNCKRVVLDENGIGEGREYATEGPNEVLKSLEETEVDVNNLCAETEDNLNYYPIKKNMYAENEVRPAIPGGGTMLNGGDPSLVN